MSGLKLTLPTAFTDTTLPFLRDDPILTAGSVALLDYTHLASPLAAGVPANSATIPNIAHFEFSKIVNETDTGFPSVYTLSGTVSGSRGLIERTGKGGLHGIFTQAGSQVAGDGFRISLSSRIRQYIIDNKTHKFYISAWDRLTRPSLTTNEDTVFYEIGSASNSNQLFIFRQNLGWVTGSGATLDTPTPTGTAAQLRTLGNRRISASVTGPGTLVGSPNQVGPEWGAALLTYGNAVGSWVNKHASSINYRFYIEDLTVSARTHAQVDAIDLSLYTKEVLTAGGRYYADTFTDPATIP